MTRTTFEPEKVDAHRSTAKSGACMTPFVISPCQLAEDVYILLKVSRGKRAMHIFLPHLQTNLTRSKDR